MTALWSTMSSRDCGPRLPLSSRSFCSPCLLLMPMVSTRIDSFTSTSHVAHVTAFAFIVSNQFLGHQKLCCSKLPTTVLLAPVLSPIYLCFLFLSLLVPLSCSRCIGKCQAHLCNYSRRKIHKPHKSHQWKFKGHGVAALSENPASNSSRPRMVRAR